MSKILAVLAFVTGALFLANAANATPVTYILTLTATNPASTIPGGSGSFSFDSAQFTGSGNEFFEPGSATKTLTSLSILIGGHTFDLSDANLGYAQVFFQNGVFSGLIYNGIDGGNVLISLTTGALSYTFSDYSAPYPFPFSQGTVAAAVSTQPGTPAPEPMTIALLGAGLAGLGFRRRKAA